MLSLVKVSECFPNSSNATLSCPYLTLPSQPVFKTASDAVLKGSSKAQRKHQKRAIFINSIALIAALSQRWHMHLSCLPAEHTQAESSNTVQMLPRLKSHVWVIQGLTTAYGQIPFSVFVQDRVIYHLYLKRGKMREAWISGSQRTICRSGSLPLPCRSLWSNQVTKPSSEHLYLLSLREIQSPRNSTVETQTQGPSGDTLCSLQ